MTRSHVLGFRKKSSLEPWTLSVYLADSPDSLLYLTMTYHAPRLLDGKECEGVPGSSF